MTYQISGTFIEACDCYVVCPCWVAAEPDEGHCTGLFAWSLGDGSTIGGKPVHGLTVVAVTTHVGGSRREGTSQTVLFVDHRAEKTQFDALVRAFSGKEKGPLAALADVSGTVLESRSARIDIDPDRASWSVTVRPETGDGPPHVHATGEPSVPDLRPGSAPDGRAPSPLTMAGTALDTELGIGTGKADDTARVEAQQGGRLVLRATGLPGAYLDLTGRSGMRGKFCYRG